MTKSIRYYLPKEKVQQIEREREKYNQQMKSKINKIQFIRIGIKITPVWEKYLNEKPTKIKKI
jgi:gamma-glutamylcysteine synthetase